MISISNCPKTGLRRKVIYRELYIIESCREVVLKCVVGYFNAEDEEITGPGITRFEKRLVASTDKVNPQTGVKLTEEQIENEDPFVEEFDFFIALKSVPVKINDLEANEIATSDIEGKFDN